jgi:hypothetical protein
VPNYILQNPNIYPKFPGRKKIGKSRKEKLESSSLCSNAQKTFAPNICSPKKQHSYFGEANVQN